MIRIYIHRPARVTALSEYVNPLADPPASINVEYDPDAIGRLYRKGQEQRSRNVRPEAFLCGKRAYVSIAAYCAWEVDRRLRRYPLDPANMVLNATDVDVMVAGTKVLLCEGLPDDEILVGTSMEGLNP